MKTTKKTPTDFAHGIYDDIVDSLFTRLGRLRGVNGTSSAMLLYQAWGSFWCDNVAFEAKHAPVDPLEATICKAIADMIMQKCGEKPLSEDILRDMFNG